MTGNEQRARCRFGSERFDILCDAAICRLFEQEFGEPHADSNADVIFTIRRDARSSDAAATGDTEHAAGDAVTFSNRYCDFRIEFGAPTRVDVRLKRSSKMTWANRLPIFAQRALTRKFNSVDEQEYGYLIYKAVLWILFLHAVKSSRLFLHASGFARRGRSVLLCGTGGVGKTSLSARILAREDTRFVSDDIVAVAPNGVAFANGMYVHAYPYNNLESALPFDGSSAPVALLNRVHWQVRKRLLGSKGACRRLSPFVLHNCEIAEVGGSQLAGIVWLTRDGSNETGLVRADGPEFARSHLEVLRDEVESAFEFYLSAREKSFEPERHGMPQNLEDAVHRQLTRLAEEVTVWRFNVAQDKSAAQNADELLRQLDQHTGSDTDGARQ